MYLSSTVSFASSMLMSWSLNAELLISFTCPLSVSIM